MAINKILLTGGAGFIGSHLLELLVDRKYQVTVLERSFSDTWRINHLIDRINYCEIGKANLEEIFKINHFDCILHLATFYKKSNETADELKEMQETNISFPAKLLDLAVKYKTRYFINTGSFFEYRLKEEKTITEESILEPYNFYAATKIDFENILKDKAKKGKIKALTLKLFAPYGEKDNEKLIVHLIKNLLANKPVDLTLGKQKWNFTYVKDIVEAYKKAVGYIASMRKSYDIFNIGTNEPVSIKEVAAILERVSGKKLLINWGAVPLARNEIFYVNCNNQKARNILGWQPQYNIEKGLKVTYSYYLNESRNL